MSTDAQSFHQQLALRGEGGRYDAQISEHWAQGRTAFGGLVAALLARALEREVPSDRPLRSALIDFVAPASPGAVNIEARVLRAGKSLVHAEARLFQNDQLVALFIGTYGAARSTQLTLQAARAPETLPPTQYPRIPYAEGLSPRFTRYFEYHMVGSMLFSGSSEGKLDGYVRHAEPGPVDAAGLLGLIDSWPPAVLPALRKPAPVSSVTWMVDFICEAPAPGTLSHDYFRYQANTIASQGGYASSEARLWGPDGALLAASRQLVVEFS